MDLSFSGAGFMGCYYFGVVDCWNKYIPRDRVNRVAGASAGSLIAAYYLMDLQLSDCLREIIELLEDVRRRPLGVFDRSNQIVDVLPRVLDKLFPEDAHKRVSNRLYVVMTRLKDMKKVIVNEFETRKDLIDALNCSCFIPVWSGNHCATYKGVKYIDGGFSDNLPIFDEHTIRICCFSGETDISPYDKSRKELLTGTILNTPLYFTFANFKRGRRALFPPPASYVLSLLEAGFQDTKTFILNNDLIQCNSCWHNSDKNERQIFNQISPSITPAISRANSYLNLNELPPTAMSNKFNFDENNNNDCNNNNSNINSNSNSNSFENKNSLLVTNNEQKTTNRASSFNKLLNLKLKNIKNNSENNNSKKKNKRKSISEDDFICNIQAPTIIIDDNDKTKINSKESPTTSESETNQHNDVDNDDYKQPASKISVGQKAFQARRNTLLNLDCDSDGKNNNLLVMKDKFKLAPEPLPSCPPSPNINRQCANCMRMRQEARMDLLEEQIRIEVEKFKVPEEIKDGGLKSKLTSPIRWIKQLSGKNSYKFQAVPDTTTGCEIPAN